METRFDQFLGLSTVLTGFDRLELLGTGMVADYLRALDTMLPSGVVDALLAAYAQLPQGDAGNGAIADEILSDPRIGPVAQNLILLWYCGSWTPLPDAWRNVYGPSRFEINGPVSAEAYLAGLQWVVAGSHPPGSGQQGFGSWSLAPERGGQ